VGLINWIFDFYQQYRIDQLQRDASVQAAVRNPAGAVDAERLERAIGELALATKTLQRVLVDKGVATPAELRDALVRVDLEDGAVDGRAPVG